MRHRVLWWVLVGMCSGVAVDTALAVDVVQEAAPLAPACPAPIRVAPDYPADMVQSQQAGSALLVLELDECGRVTEARVKQGSGQSALDEAALVAARQWVLGPASVPGAAVRRVEVPIDFSIQKAKPYSYGGPDWPESHKRAHYVLEPLAGYRTPAQVLDRYPLDPERMITPPYPNVRNTFFRQRGSEPPEYWLILFPQGEPRVAARYRLVMVEGEPVVRVAFVCDNTPKYCERERQVLMRGLPFARAR